MARIPLPPPLDDEPFRVADALALDVGRGRLRGSDLQRPFHGVRVHGVPHPALAFVPLLGPRDRFSYETAAALWPLPLPVASTAVHVTSPTSSNRHRGRGVVGHRSRASTRVLRGGLPLSPPATLFVELATRLGIRDLVAIGDALVLEPAVLDPLDLRPWIPLDDLLEHCRRSRARGARRARVAALQVRQGAESPAETRLRLLLLAAGLPEPELNVELSDHRGVMGRFDMVYRTARVIVEYDGDQHRTSTTQYDKDMTRIERAYAARWTVVRVRARGLTTRKADTVRRVREALNL